MTKKIIFIAVLFVLSCTNNIQSYDLEDIYSQSLNFLFEKKYGILLSPPGPLGTVHQPKLRYHQVSNKLYDLSSILKKVKDDKMDVSKFVNVSSANISTMDIINSTKELSKMEVTDYDIEDKRKLIDYIETVDKEHYDFGGMIILGKPLINGDLSNGEVIFPISIIHLGSSDPFAIWVKIKDNKIIKIEEAHLITHFNKK